MDDTPKKSGVLIFFGVMIVLLGLGVGARYFILQQASTANADKVAESQTTNPDTDRPYSISDISKHNKPTNCWTIVDGGVYNITKLIKENQDIVAFTTTCGVDGTAPFKGQSFTTGDLIAEGKRAPQTADQILPKYKIGKLKQ